MICRVLILENTSGTVLFDHVRFWSGPPTDKLGALLQVFFQFSGEIDTGNVSHVSFGTPAPFGRRSAPRSSQPSTFSVHPSEFRDPHSRTSSAPRPVEMAAHRQETFRCGVFFDDPSELDAAKALAANLLALFLDRHRVEAQRFIRDPENAPSSAGDTFLAFQVPAETLCSSISAS
jgi:hypothetical protein